MHVVFDCDGTLLNTDKGPESYAGVPELVEKLHREGHTLYVWTGRDPRSTQAVLKHMNLTAFFHDTRSAGECAGKPDPQGLEQMLVDLPPSQCVVIGDSWADMAGARQFGAWALGALWEPRTDGEVLRSFGAHALAGTPAECYSHVLRFAGKE